MIKILIADDHGIIRSGIQKLLLNENDIQIVAEAKNGQEAVKLAADLKPDLILMDMNMPGTDGFSACLQLLMAQKIHGKILAMSSQPEDIDLFERLLEMGVSGYLSKKSTPENLVDAIRTVYSDRYYFPFIKHQLEEQNSPFCDLEDRELQIALMVSKGMEYEEIADRLFLSKTTVYAYHHTLMRKLGIKNDAALTRMVIKYNLIDSNSVSLSPPKLKKSLSLKKKSLTAMKGKPLGGKDS